MSKPALTLLVVIALSTPGCLFAPPSDEPADGEGANNTTTPIVDMSAPVDMVQEPEDMGTIVPVVPPDMSDEPDMEVIEPDMDVPPPPPPPMNVPADPPIMNLPGFEGLSDNFEEPTTDDSWIRLSDAERWNAHQLETDEIDHDAANGSMHLVPYTTTWFQDQRGPLLFKMVEGNFVAVTRVRVTNLRGTGLPVYAFSLAGLMARVSKGPDFDGPEDWEADEEQYVFVGIGRGNRPASAGFELETKITRPSNMGESESIVTPHGQDFTVSEMAQLAIVRAGNRFAIFFRPDIPGDETSWEFVARYNSPGLPRSLQVGMVAYSNYNGTIGRDLSTEVYNESVLDDGDRDLDARFFFVHFRPVPPPLVEAIAAAAPGDMLVDLLFPSQP